MANETVSKLVEQVTRATTVIKGATILVKGIPSRIEAAVKAAVENGATKDELQPLTDLAKEFSSETEALAEAVVANTSAATE